MTSPPGLDLIGRPSPPVARCAVLAVRDVGEVARLALAAGALTAPVHQRGVRNHHGRWRELVDGDRIRERLRAEEGAHGVPVHHGTLERESCQAGPKDASWPAFLWEYSYKRLKLGQLLGQLGVFLALYVAFGRIVVPEIAAPNLLA